MSKDEQIKEMALRHKLLKIGTKVVYIWPKSDDFMKEGTIVSYYEKCPKNGMYWDYLIKTEDGFIYTDHPHVKTI